MSSTALSSTALYRTALYRTPYINYYFEEINERLWSCVLCGSPMYPDNKVNLWSHYMRVHNGVGSVILFGKPYLWIDVSSEGYGNISNIGLEIQHMFDYYNQAAYLT